ncbi:hypothetical protein ATANTOWER_015688 [Ataeniobius toweri]|uniref:Uncharacterized protein n=1 Tax=Ataeniobius toweri TaxID=208326 RepID=A0ABU7A1U9_9TELE|nr:hypothetical protein [Ataeniobius toweri]
MTGVSVSLTNPCIHPLQNTRQTWSLLPKSLILVPSDLKYTVLFEDPVKFCKLHILTFLVMRQKRLFSSIPLEKLECSLFLMFFFKDSAIF